MKKILLGLLLTYMSLFAEIRNIDVSKAFIENNETKIIDIRTEDEWKEMGIIENAYLITFFSENKKDYMKDFLEALSGVVSKDEEFAIISNTASRTKLVANFLGVKHDYKVINLIGGMKKLLEEGYEVKKYQPNTQKITLQTSKNMKIIQSQESNTSKE